MIAESRLRLAACGVAAGALVAGAGLLAPSQALAADAAASSAATDQTAGAAATVGEVVITAERREENLQNVPVAATARSGDQLRVAGVNGVGQLQNISPGLSIQPPVTSETFINIRGVGIQQTNPASSNGVAVYVDGVYIPSLIDTVDAFYDLQDVEVLRGPQGTLVGSNADGGAILINSAQPRFDSVSGYIQQTIGNFSNYRTEGGINLPINSMFAARVGFVYETRDSFTTNIGAQPAKGAIPANQNQPGNVDFEAVRLQLAFHPVDNFDATFRFEPYESRTDGFAVKPDMASYPAASSPAGFDPAAAKLQNQPFTIDYDFPQFYNISGQRTSLLANWEITPDIKLRSVTGYQTGSESDQTDIDASSAPGNYREVRKATFNTFTQELNLISTYQGPFQWVVGGYYLDESDPLVLTFLNPPPGPSISLNVAPKHENEAVFASGTYKFTDQWSLTLGGRYSHDSQPFRENLCTGFPQPCGNFGTSDSEFTWSGKLNFQVTPDTLVYFSGSSGYKAGGTNLQIPDIGFTPPPFQPETNVVEELGVKTTVLDKHLRIDGDIFDSQYSHYQLQEFAGGLPNTQGPGNASIYGAELELNGRFDDFYFDFGGSYLHGTTTGSFKYLSGTGQIDTISAGTAIPYAPDWIVNIDAGYDFHVWNGLLTPELRYQYQDTQFITIVHQVAPAADQAIPTHGTLDFRLRYTAPEHWAIEGYVTNLTNSTYIADVYQSPQPVANDLAYGPPRQFGMRLSYKF
jgi:iron complex outermembrane receptor protein